MIACCLSIVACKRVPGDGSPNHFQSRKDAGLAATVEFDHHILVDQFGYRPADPKFAVVRSPDLGYDALDKFEPSLTYQLRREADGGTVLESALIPWKQGQVESLSGDRGWWFDFSAVEEPGRYFVFDPKARRRSAAFAIDENVYRAPLKAAMRMYYYQRSGFPKHLPHAEACWVDDAAYGGEDQDTEARDITDRSNDGKRRDLRGGWFDAGDTNKYVTFAIQPVHQHLTSFEQKP
jgi:endoglucanase